MLSNLCGCLKASSTSFQCVKNIAGGGEEQKDDQERKEASQINMCWHGDARLTFSSRIAAASLLWFTAAASGNTNTSEDDGSLWGCPFFFPKSGLSFWISFFSFFFFFTSVFNSAEKVVIHYTLAHGPNTLALRHADNCEDLWGNHIVSCVASSRRDKHRLRPGVCQPPPHVTQRTQMCLISPRK